MDDMTWCWMLWCCVVVLLLFFVNSTSIEIIVTKRERRSGNDPSVMFFSGRAVMLMTKRRLVSSSIIIIMSRKAGESDLKHVISWQSGPAPLQLRTEVRGWKWCKTCDILAEWDSRLFVTGHAPPWRAKVELGHSYLGHIKAWSTGQAETQR